ncbi:MAG: cytochrome c oxidase accessory protein CcoG [Pseudomonadota bacterium]
MSASAPGSVQPQGAQAGAQPTGHAASATATVESDLFEIRRKIHPRAVSGLLARWRVAMVVLTQLAFYGTAWLQWNDRQAVLFDLAARKFYVFGFVFWPQDFIFLTGLLVVSALSLFLFTAVAGRLWCGYACPQTVYTELFMWIERRVEGDRAARMRLDAAPLDARKLRIKATKHLLWLALAAWTGFTFVGYFTPIRELGQSLLVLGLGPWESFWMVFYGFATWGNAGFMREQVCKYMCPYARFQSVMFDSDTLVVTYDARRGEPRGSRARTRDPRALGLGDCVDCGICVQVCPTGIDIRHGLQYECIGCGACVDGCNQVMAKLGYPKGLIRYSTENAIAGRYRDADILRHLARPRTLLYAGLLALVSAAVIGGLLLRTPLKVHVSRDRANLVRELDDGRLENVYRVQIINAREQERRYVISAHGIAGVEVLLDEPQPVRLPPAGARTLPVEVRVPAQSVRPGSTPLVLRVEAADDPTVSLERTTVFTAR